MYDAAVLCVVLVIAFIETSQFETGTVNNDVRSKTLDVDISMIYLHRCNGIIHLSKREKNTVVHCAVTRGRNIFLTWLIENGLL